MEFEVGSVVNMIIGDGEPKPSEILNETMTQWRVKVCGGGTDMWFNKETLIGDLPNPHMVEHRIEALDAVPVESMESTHNGLIPKSWDAMFAIENEAALIANLEHANHIMSAMRGEGLVYRDGTIQRA